MSSRCDSRSWIGTIVAIVFVGPLFAQTVFADDKADADLRQQARELFPPLPKDASTNERPITPERVRLGRMLFFDSRISVDGSTSCSRCHLPSFYGTDALTQSIAVGNKRAPRNAPTVFYTALQVSQHWDGRFVDVEDQARKALTGPGFGNADEQSVEKRLEAIGGYPAAFREAFPGDQKPVSAQNLALAIGAFERTLIVPSRFDEYLAGKTDALSSDERAGLRLFIEKDCVQCHKGAGVGGTGYRKFGVFSDYRAATGTKNPDKGRFEVTKKSADVDKFKIPGLRDVAVTPPYFHDGSVNRLNDAVKVMGKVQLDVDLADVEVNAIVAFLNSLTGPIPADYERVPRLPAGGFVPSTPAH